MKYILILLTTFTLSAFSADAETPKAGPSDQPTQEQPRQEIKNPELKAKLIEMKKLQEQMEKLRTEIKALAEKEGVKLRPRPEGGKHHKKQTKNTEQEPQP